MPEPALEKWFSQTTHTYTCKPYWVSWMVIFMKRILSVMTSLGKRPIKWTQRPDMTIAVDWDVKHQFKQTNKQTFVDKIISVMACDSDRVGTVV